MRNAFVCGPVYKCSKTDENLSKLSLLSSSESTTGDARLTHNRLCIRANIARGRWTGFSGLSLCAWPFGLEFAGTPGPVASMLRPRMRLGTFPDFLASRPRAQTPHRRLRRHLPHRWGGLRTLRGPPIYFARKLACIEPLPPPSAAPPPQVGRAQGLARTSEQLDLKPPR